MRIESEFWVLAYPLPGETMIMKNSSYRSFPLLIGLASALLMGTLATISQASPPEDIDPWTVRPTEEIERRPGSGEICLVCDQAIHDEDIIELRYRGRTFHVAAKMLEDFEDDPEAYFKKLQARTALFDEGAVVDRRMASGWLFFGLYVLLGLLCAAICGNIAISRALPPIPWFFAGLLGNVAAIFVLLATPRGDPTALPAGIAAGLNKVATTRTPIACPSCGSSNHPAAEACSHCGQALTPNIQAESARV